MNKIYIKNNILLMLSCGLALCLIASWVLYSLFGYSLIEALYTSESLGAIYDIFENRSTVPLKNYHQAADRLMVVSTFGIIILFVIIVLLVKKPIEVVLACFSTLFCFSLIFVLLEIFPHLINSLHFEIIDYYAYKANYLPDDKLAYKEKPFLNNTIHNFRGTRYSPIYDIDVTPVTVDWSTDEEGFRNSHTPESADVVLIGDSFLEWGTNELDTFPKRLEKYLPGLVVNNLGKAGYGPFQYLEVFQRYGVSKQPTYALFCFFEGNDISDMTNYLLWEKDRDQGNYGKIYAVLTEDSLQRYIMALKGAIDFLQKSINLLIRYSVSKVWSINGYIDPEIVVISLGDETYKTIFRYQYVPSTEELLIAEEVGKLREVLAKFKAISENNKIIPIVLYIPTNIHIYAEYSTQESGMTWIKQRNKAIDDKKNIERVIKQISQELNIEFVNLVTIFEEKARNGVMLFEPLDSHWNAEGRETAAKFVGGILDSKLMRQSHGEMGNRNR